MATVYILHSKKLKRFYTGSCLDFDKRYEEHNKVRENIQSYTAKADDWTLYLKIDELTYEQARQIETHIKKMKSVTYIKNLLLYPEMITNLQNKYS